jgi:hypothetical protein
MMILLQMFAKPIINPLAKKKIIGKYPGPNLYNFINGQ